MVEARQEGETHRRRLEVKTGPTADSASSGMGLQACLYRYSRSPDCCSTTGAFVSRALSTS